LELIFSRGIESRVQATGHRELREGLRGREGIRPATRIIHGVGLRQERAPQRLEQSFVCHSRSFFRLIVAIFSAAVVPTHLRRGKNLAILNNDKHIQTF
jgi:hypothetical protein